MQKVDGADTVFPFKISLDEGDLLWEQTSQTDFNSKSVNLTKGLSNYKYLKITYLGSSISVNMFNREVIFVEDFIKYSGYTSYNPTFALVSRGYVAMFARRYNYFI